MNSVKQLPHWYLTIFGILFICYVGGWLYTMHLAAVQKEEDATYIMPVGPHDSTSYANLSESILKGHFAEPGDAHEYFHTPGYPAFVAAIRFIFGGSYFAVTFIQILLVFVTALMTAALGRQLATEKIGLWASLLFLANPLVPSVAFYILTDTLFMFLLTAGFLVLVKYARQQPIAASLAAGVLFATAIYVRPIGFLAFPIFIAPLLVLSLSWRQKIFSGLAMLLLVVMLLVPWMLRNKGTSGVFSFSSLVPFNMAYYNIPHFWHDTTGLPLDQGIARVEAESGVLRKNDALGYPRNWYDLSSSPALNHYMVHVLLNSPVAYTVWHLYNSIGFFINPPIQTAHPSVNLKLLLAQGRIVELLKAATTPWWLFAERLTVLLGFALVAFGMWILRHKPLIWAFVFVILFMAAMGGPSAQARYRLPMEPILSVLMTSAAFALLSMRPKTPVNDAAKGSTV